MGKSFFGGDTSKAHYTPAVPASYHNERVKCREQRAALKAAGYQQKYFQYKVGDKKAQALAKLNCERCAAKWSKVVGFDLVVQEGMFL